MPSWLDAMGNGDACHETPDAHSAAMPQRRTDGAVLCNIGRSSFPGSGRRPRRQAQNNNNHAGETHVQGAILAGSFPERTAP